ncbi:hypothetical protein Q4512_06945 [Oceanihabitans sp. 2_MG-2023]|uniref:hypothetical protein n=1 Tax=Oceanihabitans sp. 2_MG-2023 TaxID=3062661 RepID=UPI0026E1DAFB|nr:hypothetical protein [Oceanihabitans sp. 2_MG-2023]MDO6596646.1 hypothetical protein [Oceanihabitans sp. 2_MG-2023]
MIFFKNIKKYLVLLILFSILSCNKTNWYENFKEKKKSPFGTYIVYNEAEELFSENKIHYLKENIYDYLFHNGKDNDFGNYICIKSSAYKIDADGLDYLLGAVKQGSNAFFSLHHFSDHIQDSLKFTINNLDKDIYAPEALKQLSGKLFLENETFKDQPFFFDRNIRRNYFETYNKNNTIVLGSLEVNGEKKPNFIKIYYGKGAVYLHTNPIVFTNYYMLNGNENYVENLFSYLPSKTILWDPQIKSSKYANTRNEKQDSVFKFFFKHPTLKWFLIVSFFGLLLFMVFNARRKQRAIPIIKPLENSTIEFAQTIANLYLEEEDHKNLVDKKISYFLEKIREKYLINTSNLNSEFIEKLALKSNNEISSTKYLINTIIALNSKSECTEVDLIVLNKMIENFFKK